MLDSLVKRMRTLNIPAVAALVLTFSTLAPAQAPQQPGLQGAQQTGAPGDPSAILPRIEQEAETLNSDLGRLRIEKWKVDSATKQQANANAVSLRRNLTAALPGMIQQVRANPQSLAANFKLYRNLTALYDVLASLSESAGAFGGKSEFETLAPHAAAFDNLRRSYADSVEALAANADAQIAAARTAGANAAAAAANAPPKKIVVDDNAPVHAPKKPVRKKKPSPTAAPPATAQKPPSQ